MSNAADVIRQFWLRGLKDISKPQLNDLSSWFSSEEYQVYSPLKSDMFILQFAVPDLLLSAFASDCDRMAIAAFESISSISKNQWFPKAAGWQVIQSYYSAFFAAHAILRLLGTSCTQLEAPANQSIVKIARTYGQDGGIRSVERGSYHCVCDLLGKQIVCQKTNGSGGIHEAFWTIFRDAIKDLSARMLSAASYPKWAQGVSTKLDELREVLCSAGNNNGAWLSSVRNRVNYKHELSTWFPYRKHRPYYHKLYEARNDWWRDPMEITLTIPEVNELHRFQAACQFIVGLCRAMVVDMNRRSSSGTSFLNHGSMAVLRHIGAPIE